RCAAHSLRLLRQGAWVRLRLRAQEHAARSARHPLEKGFHAGAGWPRQGRCGAGQWRSVPGWPSDAASADLQYFHAIGAAAVAVEIAFGQDDPVAFPEQPALGELFYGLVTDLGRIDLRGVEGYCVDAPEQRRAA